MSRITVRSEELVPIGRLTINACETDMVDFTALSSIFTPAYIVAARAKMLLVDAVINPEMLISERVLITQRIDKNLGLLLDPMNKLEFYVDAAEGLTVAVYRFGIKEVRAARNTGDLEALDTALRDLLANTAVAANLAALIAKGYTVVKNDDLIALRKSLSDDKAAETAKDKLITKLYTDNTKVIQGFWDILSQIWKAGKSIYKVNNPDNAKYYTISYLKAKLRNDALHGAFNGIITLLGVAKKGLEVTLKPVLGGRLRKCTTDLLGNFEISGLAGNEYAYTVYEGGVVLKADTFKLATAQKFNLSIAL